MAAVRDLTLKRRLTDLGHLRSTVLAITAALLLAACGAAAPAGTGGSAPTQTATAATFSRDLAATAKARALHDTMRKLWEDHVTWTRLYLVSAIAGLPDTAATAERLVRNQTDIGDAIKPYYGDAAGAKLTALLTDHIKIAVDIVSAAKSSDTPKLTAANARWTVNMDDISIFLSGANGRAWPLDQLKPMMRMHLELTLAEASARLGGTWADDVAAYDRVHTHILQVSDLLAGGIVGQFPEKFTD
jgi:hypothetical protein